jgi:hypothetical protein
MGTIRLSRAGPTNVAALGSFSMTGLSSGSHGSPPPWKSSASFSGSSLDAWGGVGAMGAMINHSRPDSNST